MKTTAVNRQQGLSSRTAVVNIRILVSSVNEISGIMSVSLLGKENNNRHIIVLLNQIRIPAEQVIYHLDLLPSPV